MKPGAIIRLKDRAEEKGSPQIETPVVHDPQGPAHQPPALFALPGPNGEKPVKKGARRSKAVHTAQLPLPLNFEAEKTQPQAKGNKRRKGSKGFVPVTRDPDVAQSYSDNVALDYAVARGLAQALQSLPPEELAALRTRVAKAAKNSPKSSSARNSG